MIHLNLKCTYELYIYLIYLDLQKKMPCITVYKSVLYMLQNWSKALRYMYFNTNKNLPKLGESSVALKPHTRQIASTHFSMSAWQSASRWYIRDWVWIVNTDPRSFGSSVPLPVRSICNPASTYSRQRYIIIVGTTSQVQQKIISYYLNKYLQIIHTDDLVPN